MVTSWARKHGEPVCLDLIFPCVSSSWSAFLERVLCHSPHWLVQNSTQAPLQVPRSSVLWQFPHTCPRSCLPTLLSPLEVLSLPICCAGSCTAVKADSSVCSRSLAASHGLAGCSQSVSYCVVAQAAVLHCIFRPLLTARVALHSSVSKIWLGKISYLIFRSSWDETQTQCCYGTCSFWPNVILAGICHLPTSLPSS